MRGESGKWGKIVLSVLQAGGKWARMGNRMGPTKSDRTVTTCVLPAPALCDPRSSVIGAPHFHACQGATSGVGLELALEQVIESLPSCFGKEDRPVDSSCTDLCYIWGPLALIL